MLAPFRPPNPAAFSFLPNLRRLATRPDCSPYSTPLFGNIRNSSVDGENLGESGERAAMAKHRNPPRVFRVYRGGFTHAYAPSPDDRFAIRNTGPSGFPADSGDVHGSRRDSNACIASRHLRSTHVGPAVSAHAPEFPASSSPCFMADPDLIMCRKQPGIGMFVRADF